MRLRPGRSMVMPAFGGPLLSWRLAVFSAVGGRCGRGCGGWMMCGMAAGRSAGAGLAVLLAGGRMADRLLLDLGGDGRVRVESAPEGGLQELVAEVPLGWPLDGETLEDLRWYLEDYLRAPFGVYEERGPRVAERLAGWGGEIFAGGVRGRAGAGCVCAGAGVGAAGGGGVPVGCGAVAGVAVGADGRSGAGAAAGAGCGGDEPEPAVSGAGRAV